jgi:hypothetical protein
MRAPTPGLPRAGGTARGRRIRNKVRARLRNWLIKADCSFRSLTTVAAEAPDGNPELAPKS